MSIPIRDLVVGDIIQISQGDRVPADCIVIQELNLIVDESIYGKNRDWVIKEESEYYDFDDEQQEEDMGFEVDNHK
jgi:Ca2+-transporting ATPase